MTVRYRYVCMDVYVALWLHMPERVSSMKYLVDKWVLISL